MHRLSKISAAMAVIGLSALLLAATSYADTRNSDTDEIANIIAAKDKQINNQPDQLSQTSADISADAGIEGAEIEGTDSNTDDSEDSSVEGNIDGSEESSGDSNEEADNSSNDTEVAIEDSTVSNVTSPQANGTTIVNSPNKFLPTFKYSIENLSATAKKVNAASWKSGTKIDRNIGTKLQALLNWHQNGVGGLDGLWGKNTRKAMQAFQKAQGLTVSEDLNEETWQALNKNNKLATQPVLVNYQLSDVDTNIKTTEIPAGPEAKAKLEGMYYENIIEALAEKFHMDESYLKALNLNASFKSGEIVTVYNSGKPNTKAVSRVVADKATETLYAYDDKNNLVASYPTTVGSTATPSPTGTHNVKVKVYEPNYTYTHEDGRKSIIPPGPNNPVGSVWIGLSKPSYGIHGSPDPARISRQASAGCVRLTNWDALALLGTIQNGATVEFQ